MQRNERNGKSGVPQLCWDGGEPNQPTFAKAMVGCEGCVMSKRNVSEIETGHLHMDGLTKGNAPFTALVVYLQPEFEELERRFPAYVNPDYKGKRFDPIERCKVVSKENREVAFEYVHMDRDASTDEVLAEMDRKGLRPALYEELLGFAEKYPDEQRKHPIVALGSETCVRSCRRVACLWDDVDGRGLRLSWVVSDWNTYYWFLAVRE